MAATEHAEAGGAAQGATASVANSGSSGHTLPDPLSGGTMGAGGANTVDTRQATGGNDPQSEPRTPEIEELAVGLDSSCVRLSDGSLRCWGDNQYGQLGDGTSLNRSTPVRVNEIEQAVGVATSGLHSCARCKDGTVRCWGMGEQGQLGTGIVVVEPQWSPALVLGISSATDLALAPNHTCSALSDGGARCWGNNPYGELGDGSTQQRLSPSVVFGLNDVVRVSAADDKSCALLADGSLRCWGYNNDGQLANGTHSERLAPTRVQGVTDVVQVEVGKWDTCAILRNLSVSCWGSNDLGRANDTESERATPLFAIDVPTTVPLLAGATQISVGSNHTCVRLLTGEIKCVGGNRWGQLGAGHRNPEPEAVVVSGLPPLDQVEVGLHHTCARSRREVWCWGRNSLGQMGDGTVSDVRLTPLRVASLP